MKPTFIKTTAASLAMCLTAAAPAFAEDFVSLASVESWNIVRGTETNGCFMEKVNEQGYLIRIGKTEAGGEFGSVGVYTKDKDIYVLEGETKDVEFDLDGERFYGSADGATWDGYRGGIARANNPAFGDALARKYVLTINPDKKTPLVIDLKGTFKAMDAVRACDADAVAGMDIKDDGKRADLDAAALAAWGSLMSENSRAANIAEDAVAVLVFPEITKIGFGIGAEGGNGVLVRKGGEKMGYYRTNSVSVGAQIGAQKYGYAVMFLSDKALDKFLSRRGYELGGDGSSAILERGMTAEVDTTKIKVDTVGVVFDEKGLMASATVEGSRIKPLDN
jgi:lipid-binding SYLF domain-containing protein